MDSTMLPSGKRKVKEESEVESPHLGNGPKIQPKAIKGIYPTLSNTGSIFETQDRYRHIGNKTSYFGLGLNGPENERDGLGNKIPSGL
jgi:hypothetical protein